MNCLGRRCVQRRPGALDVRFDFVVHPGEAECLGIEADAGLLAREFHDPAHAAHMRRVDEGALRLEHPLVGRRDQECRIDTVQRGPERLRPRQVRDLDFDSLHAAEQLGLLRVADQSPQS
jgi:hypothetical protein